MIVMTQAHIPYLFGWGKRIYLTNNRREWKIKMYFLSSGVKNNEEKQGVRKILFSKIDSTKTMPSKICSPPLNDIWCNLQVWFSGSLFQLVENDVQSPHDCTDTIVEKANC